MCARDADQWQMARRKVSMLRSRPLREKVAVVSSSLFRSLRSVDHKPENLLELPRPPESVRRPLTVAAVLDHFSHSAFQHEVDLRQLPLTGWRQVMQDHQPDLLLVESAWGGLNDSWRGMIAGLGGPSQALIELVSWCRTRNIPTVFWNKEDPPNFEWFIDAAGLFDFVFTVDEGCLDRYRQVLGHDRVGVLPFAAQPRLHNPVRNRPAFANVAFGGTYFRRKYPGRRQQMRMLLEPAMPFDLHIYSRTASTGANRWPRRYAPYLKGNLPYETMVEAYKWHEVYLNVSSVSSSATMCPRRVFELLATGTGLLSVPLESITRAFGELVHTSRSAQETAALLEKMIQPDLAEIRRRHLALRTVHSSHTYEQRMSKILKTVGIDAPWSLPRVTVLCHRSGIATLSDEALVTQFKAMPGVADVIVVGDGPNATECTAALSAVRTEFVSLTSDAHLYGTEQFADALRCTEYVDATIIGNAMYQDFAGSWTATGEHSFTNSVHSDSAIIATRTARQMDRFSSEGIRAAMGRERTFAKDRFNFVVRGALSGSFYSMSKAIG